MNMIQVKKSSNIAAIGYDQEAADLRIRFHNGGEYLYHGVPAEVFEGMKAENEKEGGSVGKFYVANVSKKFESEKVPSLPSEPVDDAAAVAAVQKIAAQEGK